MYKLSLNESGFSAAELILVIVVIGLLGVVGYMVYNNHKKTTLASTRAITSSTKSKTSPIPAPAATKAAPVDEKALVTQAVKDYKDNADKASTTNVTISAISGDNAYGTVSYTGNDGGGEWLAHKTDDNWAVVSQGSLGICKDEVQQYNLPASWESSAC